MNSNLKLYQPLSLQCKSIERQNEPHPANDICVVSFQQDNFPTSLHFLQLNCLFSLLFIYDLFTNGM